MVLGNGSLSGVDLQRFKPSIEQKEIMREKLNIPEKVHLACLSSSFHHCWDKDMPALLNNLKQILLNEDNYNYLNSFRNNVEHSSRLLALNGSSNIAYTSDLPLPFLN